MPKRLVAEVLGTALLLATVVGSGIMGERLADGNLALAFLGNTLATGAILVVIILIFGPISGAHFNPAVTLSFLIRREISAHIALLYVFAQIIGALLGTSSAPGSLSLRLRRIFAKRWNSNLLYFYTIY